MISPSPLPALDRNRVMDFLGNLRQVIVSKGTSKERVVVKYDDLSDYLRGQEDALHEFQEKVEAGAFDLEATQEAREGVPDLSIHFDEAKMRVDAEATLKALGIDPVKEVRPIDHRKALEMVGDP